MSRTSDINPISTTLYFIPVQTRVPLKFGPETNGMQFYPEASNPEAAVHPGIYSRNHGKVDLTSIQGAGFGYRLDEIERELPKLVAACLSTSK